MHRFEAFGEILTKENDFGLYKSPVNLAEFFPTLSAAYIERCLKFGNIYVIGGIQTYIVIDDMGYIKITVRCDNLIFGDARLPLQ
mmetsp:Transcript_46767/g.99946  ORF Transcript_46767/g.99946 Transcript_46767/m.99946 type:complete len:85 (-) Transcript_46767:534-788(-)